MCKLSITTLFTLNNHRTGHVQNSILCGRYCEFNFIFLKMEYKLLRHLEVGNRNTFIAITFI